MAVERLAARRSGLVRDRDEPDADIRASSAAAAERVARLYASHYVPMMRLASMLLHSQAAAEDVVQDAFIEVYRRSDRIMEPAGYLRRTVVNKATSVLRRSAVEERHAQRAVLPVPDEHDEIIDAVMALPPRHRAAVVLRFYCGLPDSEIADVLGVKPTTVRSLVHRSLAHLREAVAEPQTTGTN